MCCLNLGLDTLLINSLNTCRNQSFSLEDLKKLLSIWEIQKIVMQYVI